MEAQQFHLKWNNHSLNTLSSFQHLLDTNCLVDVSLTCSSGKIVPAHRMVLAACSDYFYTLFKDLPEKHPVIVFKDASEQILQDLLEFMYRGEVEVDETNLSDFLKFADTLQVKGLSQSDSQNWRGKEEQGDVSSTAKGVPVSTPGPNTPRDTPPSAKDVAKLLGSAIPEPVASMNKLAYQFNSSLAGYPAKFPSFFPQLPNGDPADLYSHLASPNLFNALKRKYPVALGQKGAGFLDPDSPVLKMPFLKDYFGKHPLDLSESGRLSTGYGSIKDEDSDDIAEHSPPPSDVVENGAMENDNNGMMGHHGMNDLKNSQGGDKNGGGRKPQGRGSRLERMIAAEYKILSEYSEQQGTPSTEVLPAITPELMKSRRTHSLQLAIGEILHNRASVQSAATKYHIPRETLRRHYQRYLKAMGIQKEPGAGMAANAQRQTSTPTKNLHASSMETLAIAAASAVSTPASNDESSNGYSSLLDIGQAYGIWTPGEDNSNDITGPRDLKIVEDEDECPLPINVPVNDKEKAVDHTQEDKVESSTPVTTSPAAADCLRESPSNTSITQNTHITQNNNNVAVPVDKAGLAGPRVMPMETV